MNSNYYYYVESVKSKEKWMLKIFSSSLEIVGVNEQLVILAANFTFIQKCLLRNKNKTLEVKHADK